MYSSSVIPTYACLILTFLLSFPLLSFTQQNSALFQLSVLTNSSISIKGSSNVNTFNCTACSPFKHHTIQGSSGKGKTVNLKGSITVPIVNFDCRNKMLNKDLRKTLQAEEYPSMTIHFIDIERMPTANAEIDRLKGTVQIELAGKRKSFCIQYIINRKDKSIRLDGSRSFTFSDFDLTPPKKIGGMIKVKDDFDVNFSLYLARNN